MIIEIGLENNTKSILWETCFNLTINNLKNNNLVCGYPVLEKIPIQYVYAILNIQNIYTCTIIGC